MKVDLFMSCPVCLSRDQNSAKEYWRHAGNCQGVFCLDERAYIHCKGCHKSAPLTQMRLLCGSGKHTFAVASVEGYAAAISTSAALVNEGGLAWLQKVMHHLGST